MILTLLNQKGGVGKSTIAVNVSACLAKKGHRVLLIDMDEQGSAAQWHNLGQNEVFQVSYHPKPTIENEVDRLRREYHFITIDLPPGNWRHMRAALAVTNRAVIPLGPSVFDLWSCDDILKEVDKARETNKGLEVRLLVSKAIPGTTPAREMKAALKSYGVPVFRTIISQRIAYVKSMTDGISVLDFEPNGQASDEIKHLTKEILKWA